MNQAVEEQVRALAEPLWESAARPYGMAMDFWLMAEQMVLEMMAATTRMQSVMLTEPPSLQGVLPEAAPVAQIRAMAECMWDSAGRQYGMAQEFWLAAERHVLAMMRAANVGNVEEPVEQISALTPPAYLERIRTSAYYMWESAGRQYGQALEFWLAAERQALAMLTAVYTPPIPDRAAPEGRQAVPPEAAPEPEPAVEPTAEVTQPEAAEPEPAAVAEPAMAAEVPQPEVVVPILASGPAADAAASEPAGAKRRKRTTPGRTKASASMAGADAGGQSEANDR